MSQPSYAPRVRLVLIDGRVVPLAKGKYKHLVTWLETTARHHTTRERVVARCRGIAGMLARLGCLTAAQYVEAVDIAVRSVIMYFGAATPMSRSVCERIDRQRQTYRPGGDGAQGEADCEMVGAREGGGGRDGHGHDVGAGGGGPGGLMPR